MPNGVVALGLLATIMAGCAREPSPEREWLGEGFYSLDVVDQEPRLRSCRRNDRGPVDRNRRYAVVTVRFDVTRYGQVANPTIGYARAGAATNEAISQAISCTFDPALINGVAVGVRGMSMSFRVPRRR